jgi:hypothetical protein
MKDKKEILEKIKKIKDDVYQLIQEEDYEMVDNTEEIETYRYAIITLEWVLNL